MDDRRQSIKSLISPIFESLACAAHCKLHAAALVLVLGVLIGPPQSRCAVACKPMITIKSVHLSELHDMQRVWTAILAVNASYCATSIGRFEIDFVREKEHAPDMQFTEQFDWRPGEIEVSITLWWDEVVPDYRIGFVAPCVCREWQF